MKQLKAKLWEPGEYHYKGAYGFEPMIYGYLHEDDKERPCMIVVPGGGYSSVSPSESEVVAMDFFEKGYQAFVCVYTVNPLGRMPLKLQALRDLSRAVRWVRSKAGEFRVNPNQVAICGFSAGGHLCGSLAVHFSDVSEENAAYAGCSNRPDAAVLAYPVITSGEKAHCGSFDNLLGKDATEEELRYMSLELQVTEQTTPCFLWHTETDDAVPVENSYLMAEACREKGVPYALHVFSEGCHGLSLATEAWANSDYSEPYCSEQSRILLEKIDKGEISATQEERMMAEGSYNCGQGPKTAADEVAVWPVIADAWLKKVMG